jgi:hypothetical protein
MSTREEKKATKRRLNLKREENASLSRFGKLLRRQQEGAESY